MTLKKRLILRIAAQLGGVAVLVGVGLWGQGRLRVALERTTDQLGAVRAAHSAGHHLAMARQLVQRADGGLDAPRRQVQSAIDELERMETLRNRSVNAPDAAQVLALTESLSVAINEGDRNLLLSGTTSGIAAILRITQDIQRDVRQRRADAIAANNRAALNLGIAGALIVLLSAGMGVSQLRCIMRPIGSLRRGVDRLRRGDFSGSVDCEGDPHLCALADQFNEMADELRRARENLEQRIEERTSQLIRSERLARLGVIAAGFAHEINNPLAIIRAHAELAVRHWEDDRAGRDVQGSAREMAAALEVAIDEVDRSRRIVDELQALGSQDQKRMAQLVMHDVAATAMTLIEPIASNAGCELVYRCESSPNETRVLGNEGELVQILINLLLNAIDASKCAGCEVRIACMHDSDGVVVRVADNGIGMTSEELARAFDPFVSGNGRTGLGLAVCQAIADRHGARLLARSDGPGAGSEFLLVLPAIAAEVAA